MSGIFKKATMTVQQASLSLWLAARTPESLNLDLCRAHKVSVANLPPGSAFQRYMRLALHIPAEEFERLRNPEGIVRNLITPQLRNPPNRPTEEGKDRVLGKSLEPSIARLLRQVVVQNGIGFLSFLLDMAVFPS